MADSTDSTDWDIIYDKWLREGDLKLLMYINKIERYLDHGRTKSEQERLNLIAQINGLLDLKYNGTYRYIKPVRSKLAVSVFKPNIPLRIPSLNKEFNMLDVITVLQNPRNIRIKPQAVSEFPTHPLWLLWLQLYHPDISDYLWVALSVYRKIFNRYMYQEKYTEAACVLQHACKIKIRKEPLPFLHPHVLKTVMYVNIDNKVIS